MLHRINIRKCNDYVLTMVEMEIIRKPAVKFV